MLKIITGLNKILSFFLVGFFVVLLGFVCWSVFTRYVLNNPSVASEEIIRFCLIWLIFIGSAYTYGEKKHLAIEALANKLKAKQIAKVQILIYLIILAISVLILIYGGGNLSWKVYLSKQLSPTLHISMGLVYMIFPFSGLIMSIYSVVFIADEIQKLQKEG